MLHLNPMKTGSKTEKEISHRKIFKWLSVYVKTIKKAGNTRERIAFRAKKYSQLNFGKGHQIWWLLSYEWFRNLSFGCSVKSMAVITVVIALLITASSFFGCLHSHTLSLHSLLHSCCTGFTKREILDRWSRGTKTLGTRVWLPYGNLRTPSRSS